MASMVPRCSTKRDRPGNILQHVDLDVRYAAMGTAAAPTIVGYTDQFANVVPLAGLEPACLSAFDFESNASTNFATGAAIWRR